MFTEFLLGANWRGIWKPCGTWIPALLRLMLRLGDGCLGNQTLSKVFGASAPKQMAQCPDWCDGKSLEQSRSWVLSQSWPGRVNLGHCSECSLNNDHHYIYLMECVETFQRHRAQSRSWGMLGGRVHPAQLLEAFPGLPR